MQRKRQLIDDIVASLTPIETTWRDEHADAVIARLQALPAQPTYSRSDLAVWLNLEGLEGPHIKARFEANLTAIQLFLDISKDEFRGVLRDQLGPGQGLNRFKREPETFYKAFDTLGLLERMRVAVNSPLVWYDLLIERLKGGRGSAIKGQVRGRSLEDFVESYVEHVFGAGQFDVRCSFHGARGTSTEKTDFAIPNKSDARILIEVKAYGATGSKQTDVIGDLTRIIAEKRADTTLLLVTDGITWNDRLADLRKLVEMQHHGDITRIYTRGIKNLLIADLQQLKGEYAL